jgi:AcrR family transcriptional regulator
MVRNPDDTQQRLIATAAAIIAVHGVAGLRVDEVAKQARINKRMIYHYFGSKDGLWLRVLDQSVVDLCASLPELSDATKAFLRAELLMNSPAPKSINESPITASRLQRAAQIILRRFLDGPVVSSELQDHDWQFLYLLLCRLAFGRTKHEEDLDVSKHILTAPSGEPSAMPSSKPRYQLRPSFRIE